jgi:PTH1 family peptidyl-tRNA hydrolase
MGLGNPGKQYTKTRHNIGFEAVRKISEKYKISLDQKKHKALLGSGYMEGQKVLLAQPQTFMNLSGESLQEILTFYKLSMEDLILIYDDVSLSLGDIRIRKQGSAGGHNGVKSIIQLSGTSEFVRIKVGVDEKPKEWDLADYVLSAFAKADEKLVEESLDNVVNAVTTIVVEDLNKAMNIYNQKKSQDI